MLVNMCMHVYAYAPNYGWVWSVPNRSSGTFLLRFDAWQHRRRAVGIDAGTRGYTHAHSFGCRHADADGD